MTDKIQRANLGGTIGSRQPHGGTAGVASRCPDAQRARLYIYIWLNGSCSIDGSFISLYWLN